MIDVAGARNATVVGNLLMGNVAGGIIAFRSDNRAVVATDSVSMNAAEVEFGFCTFHALR